jgi:transposase
VPEQRPMPDWEWVSTELGRRGVTLMLIWEEYRQQHRDGYSYRCYGAGDEGWHHRRW